MDCLITKYQQIIKKIYQEYAIFLEDNEIKIDLIFDTENNHYLLIETGWQNDYRIYGTLLHLDIINNKIWIQHDGTEEGIADELMKEGIPKQDIVLAFKPNEIRALTGFAVS
ncbi:XisI protein [Geminocystis sp. CENA526]|uniref:XisI protein n=1 Tax=Geminocystis sp. CENA526 TaxID=1355871 RepID=UPI003D6E74BC